MDNRDVLIARAEMGQEAQRFLASAVAGEVLHDAIRRVEIDLACLGYEEHARFSSLVGARRALLGVSRALEAMVALGQQAEQVIAAGDEHKEPLPRII